MGADRLLDRVEAIVAGVLESRVPEGDSLEWAVAVVPVLTEGCEEHGPDLEMTLSFFATLNCPEAAHRQRIVASVLIPLRECHSGELEASINDIWDRMTVSRMEQSVSTGGN